MLEVLVYQTFLAPSVSLSDKKINQRNLILIGDFKKKRISDLDRADISLLRGPYSCKPFIVFYITKRIGGDVMNENAFRILRSIAK